MDQNIPFSQWPEVPDYDMGEPFYQEGVKWTTRHNFELEKKHILRIADALAEMKTPRIEAGMPVVSKAVENAMRRMVARNYPHSKIYGFARAVIGDVDLCKDVGCQGIIIEYCVNPIIIKHAYRKTPKEVVSNLIAAINHAKEIGFEDVAFMGWDWFRTPIEFTRPLIQEIYDNTQLDGLVIVDTYGSSTPDAVEEMFRLFKEWFPRLRLEFHGHTDNGCGDANCLAALWGGAEVIHTSINGMGERQQPHRGSGRPDGGPQGHRHRAGSHEDRSRLLRGLHHQQHPLRRQQAGDGHPGPADRVRRFPGHRVQDGA